MHKSLFTKVAGLLLAAWLLPAAHAQGPALSCPNNVVRLIVPWSAGGATDAAARFIAVPLAQRLGLNVVVENKAGAGGTIGTAEFVREKPDGCTLLVATSSTNAAAPYLYARTGFDPAKDFTPIAFISSIPNILVVGASSPYKSVAELVAAAKASPGKLTYGTGGNGSSQHLAGAMLKNMAQIDIVHVPYRSSAPAVVDLMGGHVSLVMDTGSLGHIRGGKVRALAVASKKRLGILPDVPTFDEAGVPGLYFTFWVGIVGPAGMPKALVDRLNADVNAVIVSPTTQKQLVEMGGEVSADSAEGFGRLMRSELKSYAEIVKISGAKLEQ
jgi:tripartite-type tricarboxylate transporter receptor subunit TctC